MQVTCETRARAEQMQLEQTYPRELIRESRLLDQPRRAIAPRVQLKHAALKLLWNLTVTGVGADLRDFAHVEVVGRRALVHEHAHAADGIQHVGHPHPRRDDRIGDFPRQAEGHAAVADESHCLHREVKRTHILLKRVDGFDIHDCQPGLTVVGAAELEVDARQRADGWVRDECQAACDPVAQEVNATAVIPWSCYLETANTNK